MKNKDFAALANQLRPQLPDFVMKGAMLAKLPVKFSLRGLYFDRSSFDAKSFYVYAFFLPLFIPTDVVSFNLGERLRVPAGGDRWSTEMPDLIKELAEAVEKVAIPFLSGIESPLDIAMAAERNPVQKDPYVRETIAYAYARAGETARAIDELGKLIRLLDASVVWQRAMADRAGSLKTKLLGNPEEAKAQLDAWEFETVHNLGLDNFKS